MRGIALSMLRPKALSFEKSAADPMAAQRKLLLQYVLRNKDTEFGKKYGFSSVNSPASYMEKAPVSNYEFYRPYIDRMAAGEQNILTKDSPVFFGMTSGTTGRAKLIPNTGYGERRKSDQLKVWVYHFLKAHPASVEGKILAIISPEVEGYTACGIPYGLESGHGYKRLPAPIKSLYAVPYPVFTIKDHNARYYTILRISVEQSVTTISSLNPYTLILLGRKMGQWGENLAADVENGSLSAGLKIEKNIRARLEKRLKPNRRRAAELRKIIENEGRLSPRCVWKDMGLITCWKGGSMAAYLKELSSYFKGVPVRDMGCVSTEARSSIPMSDNGAQGALAVETNFYEFLEASETFSAGPRTLTCAEVEIGREYIMVVTTPNGLYRYWTDDVVRVAGFFRKTPIIEFVRRSSAVTSLAGENLSESQINTAVMACGFPVEFFCAVAAVTPKPIYEFLVEFSRAVSDEEGLSCLRRIDDELKRQNSLYKYSRDAELLEPPLLKAVKKGAFAAYRERLISKGAPDGQMKTPVLTADEKFADYFDIDRVIRMG